MPVSAEQGAREYLSPGWQVVPVPNGQKAPRLKGWQNLRLSPDVLPCHFSNGSNVGVLLGNPSGDLVDIDLDCAEARALADAFLPETNRVHGRPGAPRSHRWYVAQPLPKSLRLSDPDGTTLVELRATGQQTIVPPS